MVPLPDHAQPCGSDGVLRPICRCNAALDPHGHYQQVCKYSGTKSAHDGNCVQAFARPALLVDNDTQVLTLADSKKSEALLNLTREISLFVGLHCEV